MAGKRLSKSVAAELAHQELSRIADHMPGIWIEHAPIQPKIISEQPRGRSALLWTGVVTTSFLIFGLWVINMTAMFSDRARTAKQNTSPIEAAGADLSVLFKSVETNEGTLIREAGHALAASLENRQEIKQALQDALATSLTTPSP